MNAPMKRALRLIVLEGNPASMSERLAALGAAANAEIYARSVRHFAPDADITILHPADGPASLPKGVGWSDIDGVILGGSGLNVTSASDEPEILRQIDVMRAAAEASVPLFGSCWGLQVAAVAAGGEVAPSPNGREVGVARRIRLTAGGMSHPVFKGKPAVFDAPCIHFDEVVRLPGGSTVLADNHHSAVQAAEIPIGNSTFAGVQYHPEFDLAHLAALYRRFAEDLIHQGLFAGRADVDDYARRTEELGRCPDRRDLAWQLAIDADVTDIDRRCREIGNWVRNIGM